jgi:hypothetical protein
MANLVSLSISRELTGNNVNYHAECQNYNLSAAENEPIEWDVVLSWGEPAPSSDSMYVVVYGLVPIHKGTPVSPFKDDSGNYIFGAFGGKMAWRPEDNSFHAHFSSVYKIATDTPIGGVYTWHYSVTVIDDGVVIGKIDPIVVISG